MTESTERVLPSSSTVFRPRFTTLSGFAQHMEAGACAGAGAGACGKQIQDWLFLGSRTTGPYPNHGTPVPKAKLDE